MSERGFDMRRNGVGLVLFAIGAFFAVLLIKSFTSDVPVSEAGGTAALAALWIDSVGAIAGLVFCAGLALIGARIFLSDADGNVVKHAGGLALVAVGISILAGAVSEGAGGALGRAIGGGLSGSAHVAVGALAGIGVIALAVWGVWLKGTAAPRADLEAEIEDDGVSAEEAAALIPTDSNRTLAESRKTERASTWTAPPSPYPEDVRRRGEIPAGAKPLDPTHVPTTAQGGAQAGSVYRWTAARADEPADRAGEDLAGAVATAPQWESAVDVVEESELPTDTPEIVAQELTADDRVAVREIESDEIEIDELDEIEEELSAAKALVAEELEDEPQDRVETIPAPRAESLPEVPRPSWEQSSLFDEGDEPVDAYGTPLTLVEEVASAVEESDEVVDEEDDESEEDESDEDENEEYDEYEDDAEDSEEDEDADEDAYEDEGDEEEGEAEEVDEAEEVYAEDESAEDDPAEEEIPETEEEISRKPAVASDGPLKDVVLTPQPAPAIAADRQRLLVDAGCLFLDRGRVAVSMLQRQYSMDFDEACKVLDELQELGLIGPYLGGQRRDILLTRDQWLERVASS